MSMLTYQSTLRVRYNETDQMGVVNNANYATYFEIARSEMFRHLGLQYAQMEKEGLMMPVRELFIKYHHPAYYDQLLTIETTIPEMPQGRMRFNYRILNEENQLVTEGYVVLAFLNAQTQRPMRATEEIINVLKAYF